MKFYQYFYGNMNFILYKNKADIENISFLGAEQLQLGKISLKGGMTYEEVIQGLGLKHDNKGDVIYIYHKEPLDDYYTLEFRDNQLYKFSLYSPC